MSMVLFVRQLLFNAISHYRTGGNSYSHKMLWQKMLLCLTLLTPSIFLLYLSGCNSTDQIHHTTISNVLPSHTFTVTAPPSLTLHNDSGSVTLHTGKENAVVITATQHVTGVKALSTSTPQRVSDSTDMQVNYDQQGNTVRVEALNISNAALRAVSVDFDVTMPAKGDVQIYTGFGSITVDGIHGRATLESEDGDISVHNSDGPMTINGSNGSVSADNIQGTLSLTLSNGDIKLHHMRLTGSSQIATARGSIFFNGSLNPSGSYRFRSENGTIDLILPDNSSFNLDAVTTHGTIENDFGSTLVGDEPRALLRVSTELGSIALHSK